ncbi:MAG: SsrA-binding protein SmpB [Planctomycetota bacterium]|jgi:SsrA-binding protein
MAKKGKPSDTDNAPRITNRRARHDYHITETLVCGIQLTGTEVKSVRQGHVTLNQSFCQVDPNTLELWLHNAEIQPYANAAAHTQHEPQRPRKLLAKKREIKELLVKTGPKGMSLVPLAMFFNRQGFIKVEIGLGTGKGQTDKRETLKKRDAQRDIQRAMTRKHQR